MQTIVMSPYSGIYDLFTMIFLNKKYSKFYFRFILVMGKCGVGMEKMHY